MIRNFVSFVIIDLHMPVLTLIHLTLLLDKQSVDNGGKEFRYFCLNFQAHTSVNCLDTVCAKTKDTQSEDDTSLQKMPGKEIHKSSVGFLVLSILNFTHLFFQ